MAISRFADKCSNTTRIRAGNGLAANDQPTGRWKNEMAEDDGRLIVRALEDKWPTTQTSEFLM